MNKQDELFTGVLSDGRNFDVSTISGCQGTMDDCERNCRKYYGCYTIALANDILVKYEEMLSVMKSQQ